MDPLIHSDSPPPIKLRKRADTQLLLGEKYQETVVMTVDPPQPEKHIQQYTHSRVVNALEYADVTLRHPTRKLTPLAERALKIYKDACVGFLSLKENEYLDQEEVQILKEDLVSKTRTYEGSSAFRGFMTPLDSSTAQELQDKILELKRVEIHTRYGDLLAAPCKTLRVRSEAEKTEGWIHLSKLYWTTIDDMITKERQAYMDVRRGLLTHKGCETTLTVAAACRRIGVVEDDTIAIIHMYVERNRCMHTSLETMIQEGKFDDLKNQLSRDANDLPAILPASDTTYLNIVMHLLHTLIDQWFVRLSDDPQTWIPNDTLIKLYSEYAASQERLELAKSEMKTATEKELMKRLREDEKKRTQMKAALEGGSIDDTKTNTTKRVSSAQVNAERAKYRKQLKQYDTIVHIQIQTTKLADAYVAAFGPDSPDIPVMDPYA